MNVYQLFSALFFFETYKYCLMSDDYRITQFSSTHCALNYIILIKRFNLLLIKVWLANSFSCDLGTLVDKLFCLIPMSTSTDENQRFYLVQLEPTGVFIVALEINIVWRHRVVLDFERINEFISSTIMSIIFLFLSFFTGTYSCLVSNIAHTVLCKAHPELK